jgi:hypothetical protein
MTCPGGLCTAGNCSLRQAVFASNVCGGEQTIRIPAGTYRLTLLGFDENENATGDLDITGQVRIVGDGMPIIDGNATDRIFDIHAGAIVEMSGLVIQNGFGGDGFGIVAGGGVTNAGSLTATGVLIQNNRGRPLGTYAGGGLANTSTGTASISHSAIISNISGEGGGGVSNYGEMTLDNVTISGNVGFGIMSVAPLEISYSTITDNRFSSDIAGTEGYFSFQIHNVLAPIVIRNSIVAGYPDAGACWGVEGYRSEGFNVEYSAVDTNPLDTCNFTQSSDMVGIDPMLLPLDAAFPIHPLDPASPAIDSANPANCSRTDQRGVARPQGSRCDRGAYEKEASIIFIEPAVPALPPPAGGITLTPPPLAIPSLVIRSEIPCLPCILVILVPANCRQGPGINYPVVNSALPGEQVQVIGKSMDGTWWYSQVDNDKCFISNIAGIPQGDLSLLTIISDPPTPVPTKTPVVEDEPEATEEVIVEPDNDGDGYSFSKDCNDKDPKINPGAVETPDDKVDSNCNGDDDK